MIPQRFKSSIAQMKRILTAAPSSAGLTDILSHSGPKMELHERMLWLEKLLFWLRKGDETATDVRFRLFFQVLHQNPQWQKHTQASLAILLKDCRFLGFFTHTGYAADHGLWSDLSSRLLAKVLPTSGTGDFQEIILNVFKTEGNIEWLAAISDDNLLKLKALLLVDISPTTWQALRKEIQEGLLILSAHIAHHGLSSDVRLRLDPKSSIADSSFLRLGAAIQKFVYDSESEKSDLHDFKAVIEACRRDLTTVYERMESSGASVGIVHKLELLSALLEQVERLLRLGTEKTELEMLRDLRNYVVTVAQAGLRGRSIRGHMNRHMYLLARKIAERNGQSGEHYISRNKKEIRALFTSAIGGGMVVVGMTVFKTFLIRSEPAPFFLAMGVWIIYAAGFLTMQFRGYTLATKIPSFTASLLARKLKDAHDHEASADLSEEMVHIFRSQFVGLLGNLTGLIPLVIALGFLSRFLFHGHELMSEHYALHALADLNPTTSLVVLLGALTGVILWASSICGGWFENWIVFNRIPEAVEHHQILRRIFGAGWTKRLSLSLVKNASGLGTNVSLGFLFGFVPFIGSTFGLNLDSKHVTISTTGAAFAFSSLHYSAPPMLWINTAIGLLSVGVMNFLVSFVLALVVATRSQKMRLYWVWRYLRGNRARVAFPVF